MNEHAPPPADGSRDAHWILDALDSPAVLVDARGALVHANAASRALAERLRPGSGPELFVAALPSVALPEARVHDHWSGDAGVQGRALSLRVHAGPAEQGEAAAFLLTIEEPRPGAAGASAGRDALEQAYRRAGTPQQLLQSEKMASIGQLAAGVAHEINNPIGYVHSNLGTLQEYAGALLALLEAYEAALQSGDPASWRDHVLARRETLDIDFIAGDLPKLLDESREGIERVTRIVQDLKDFSRSSGSGEPMRPADLHKGLESTINIVWNELKYKVNLERHYGALPPVECHASEINQVLMTLLINAGQAIESRGSIVIASGAEDGEAWISIADTGCGIAPEVLARIFEPFFTTKPIGRGTGLGLAVAYSIVAKHNGRIEVSSRPGSGSVFRLVLPIRQPGPGAG